MYSNFTLADNPYCAVKHDEVRISYGNKTYCFALQNIDKMFLSRKKRNYLSFIPGIKYFTLNATYSLSVVTIDGKETTINVRAVEKQYFIGLLSFIRNLKKVYALQNKSAA